MLQRFLAALPPSPRPRRVARLLAVLLAGLLLVPAAQARLFAAHADKEDFLPVRDAFRLTLERDDQALVARWQIADRYYLYRDKFRFELVDGAGKPLTVLAAPEFPRGESKEDELFGRVEVYHHAIAVRLPLRTTPPGQPATLRVSYQGCAEAGLCYPPQTEEWPVDFSGMAATPAGATGAAIPATPAASGSTAPPPAANDAGALEHFLSGASFLVIVGTFLLLGLGLAFTPCVLPMVPILSSIIVGEGQRISTRRAFGLSLAYVLGMALTYTVAGIVVGLLGKALAMQLWLQSPPVLVGVALLFVLLSLSMFGLYELQLPAFLRDRLNAASGRWGGGRWLSVALMGAVSALVMSPCVSAPLAGALMFIGSTGNAVLGGSALFALAFGMGIPLLLIGTSGGRLLPKAGAWMVRVKIAFGILLLGVAILVLGRILPGPATLALWALLAIVSAAWLGAAPGNAGVDPGWRVLRRGVALAVLLYGVLLGVGAAAGGDDPLSPLAPLRASATGTPAASHVFTRVSDRADLAARLAAAKAAGKPVLLDFYADWCVACRVMAREVFPRPAVRATLARYELLQVDVSASTDDNLALLGQYGIPGLPAFLFFRPDGSEVAGQRILGELDSAGFIDWVRTRIEPNLQGSR